MDSYADKKRMSEEHFQLAAIEKPDETTSQAITALVNDFATTLGEEPARNVRVIKDPLGLYGWCSDGVLEKIKHDGGGIRFGWTIWEWPQVLLTAEFHAVWASPGGELIDVTPKPNGEDRIVFVPDASYPPDFNFDNRPTNKRKRLYQAADRSAEIAAHIAQMTSGQLAYEQKRAAKAALTLEEYLHKKRQLDPMVVLIDDFIRVCDECDQVLDATPGLGEVEPTPRLGFLMAEKLRLLAELKRRRGL